MASRPRREPKQTILTFVSTEIERSYVEALKRIHEHHVCPVRSVPNDLTFDEVVRRARTEAAVERRKGSPFDQVWVISSFGSTEDLAEAVELGRQAKVLVAGSVPSFETWLHLHFADLAVSIDLDAQLPERTSSLLAEILRSRTSAAISRSERSPGRTTVHELARAFARSELRFRGLPGVD